MGVVIDPVEHLPHRLLTERRQRLVKRGIHEILAQATLRAVDHRGPQRAARGVEDGGTDDAQRQGDRRAWWTGWPRAACTTVPRVRPIAPIADAVSATPVVHARRRARPTCLLAARVGDAGWATGVRVFVVAVDIVSNLRRGADTTRTVFRAAGAEAPARAAAPSAAGVRLEVSHRPPWCTRLGQGSLRIRRSRRPRRASSRQVLPR